MEPKVKEKVGKLMHYSSKRTIKKGVHISKQADREIRKNHDVSCEMFFHERKKPNVALPQIKKKTRWCPGYCTICGEFMDIITHSHAQSHGYKDADAMIAAGKVRWAK